MIVADLPWMSYHLDPVDTVRNGALAHPGRRPGGQAGRRRQPGPDDRGAGRRRNPGHGPSRPHPAVDQRHGGLPGPGSRRRRGPCPEPGGQGHLGRRLLRRGPRGGPRTGGRSHHRVAGRAHHRDRGGPGLRRAGPGLPRPARLQRASVPKFVRRYAELERPRSPRWPPTRPTCARGHSPPMPRSTTELGRWARRRWSARSRARRAGSAGRFAGRVERLSRPPTGGQSSSDLPHAVGLGRPVPDPEGGEPPCGHTKQWLFSIPVPTRQR